MNKIAAPTDTKIPMFAISLVMLDEKGQVIINKSGGNDNILEVTSIENFRLLAKAFRKDVKAFVKGDKTLDQRKAEWTEEDEKAAADRRKKLEDEMRKNEE